MRRAIPYSLLPLSLIACALASAPWLRAYPSSVMSVPLFGAALLSVLTPLIIVGIGVRRLWVTCLADIALFVFYELLVTLRAPAGFADLYSGLVHGPSQILTFALPLVSPRTLLVAPVALCWLSGALIGEFVARAWQSALPYLALLVTFGLSYAGTARAITSASDGRRYDTLLAAALLIAILLLRAAQAWVIQEQSAEITQPDGVLPLRGLAVGAVLSVAIALVAAGVVQSSAFSGHPAAPARVPPLDQSRPLTPISFVSGLRPSDPKSAGDPLFTVTTDKPSSNYLALATVDFYDGDGWSFDRTFRPSGGVIPADTDTALNSPGKPVTQQYKIADGALTTVPWMPYLERPQRVTGAAVNVDPTSGMIVPSHALRAGESYTIQSTGPSKTFAQLGRSALVGTSAPPVDTALANGLAAPLGTLVQSLATETGASSAQPVAFLQAVARDFQTKSALAGGPATSSPSPSPSATPTHTSTAPKRPTSSHRTKHKKGSHFVAPLTRPSSHKKPTHPASHHRTTPAPRTSTPSVPTSPSATPSAHTGGTTFADVLASIRAAHSATPEQYATLTALIARELGVPARLVAGFRVPTPSGGSTLPAGRYTVTSAESWTWVEIPIRGQGWVVLDPSPGTYGNQTPPAQESAQPSSSPSPSPSQTALLTNSNSGGNAAAPKSTVPHSHGISTTAIVVIVLVAVAVALLLFGLFLLGRKRLRVRRRRRAGDPRRRLLGAWQESLDVLEESGLPDLTHLTSAEVAAVTGERFGPQPGAQARYIGDAANVAIFSPTSWIGPGEADAAWRAQVVLSKAVRRRLGWRDRLGASVRYHRNRRTAAASGPSSWVAAAEARRQAALNRGRHASGQRRRRRDRAG